MELGTAFHCALLPSPEGPGPVGFVWSHDHTFAKCVCAKSRSMMLAWSLLSAESSHLGLETAS